MLSSMCSRTRMWLGFCSERLLFSTSRSCLLSLETQRAASSQQKRIKKKKDEKKGSERSAGIRSKSTATWRGEIHKAHPSFASPLLALPALRSDALPGGHGHETAQLGGASCLRESQQQLRARRVSECHEFDLKWNRKMIFLKCYVCLIFYILYYTTQNTVLPTNLPYKIWVSTTSFISAVFLCR